MIRRMTRSTLMIGALIAAMTLGVQLVLAETVVSTTGSIGRFEFLDNHGTTPGANCDYKTHKVNGTHRLADISIRAPKVFARNSSRPNTPRVVGWRFRSSSTTPSSTAPTIRRCSRAPWSRPRRPCPTARTSRVGSGFRGLDPQGQLPGPGHHLLVPERLVDQGHGQGRGPHRLLPGPGWRAGHGPADELLPGELILDHGHRRRPVT